MPPALSLTPGDGGIGDAEQEFERLMAECKEKHESEGDKQHESEADKEFQRLFEEELRKHESEGDKQLDSEGNNIAVTSEDIQHVEESDSSSTSSSTANEQLDNEESDSSPSSMWSATTLEFGPGDGGDDISDGRETTIAFTGRSEVSSWTEVHPLVKWREDLLLWVRQF